MRLARNSAALLALISKRADEFFRHLPGIRDGQPDSVHEARVACRRLRELLPIVGEDRDAVRAYHVLTEAGRELGRVRDLDVMTDLLAKAESVVPAAALAIALLRRAVLARLREQRRALVKSLEHLELARVSALRKRPHLHSRSLTLAIVADPRSESMLRDRIGQRAQKLRTAVEHAAGVYFPHRLHATRIAVKKLRYAVEVALDIGVWTPPHLLGDLRKIQTILGDMHDNQVLVERVKEFIDQTVPREETAVLVSILTADIARLHAEYLTKRNRLMAIAGACERFSIDRKTRRLIIAATGSLAATSAVAIPVALALFKNRRPPIPTERILTEAAAV